MADVNANIGVQIDTSDALAQLKSLQRQLSQFHTSVAKSSSVAAAAQKGLQKNLIGSINSIGAFSAELRTVKTSSESFTHSLEKNKFSMREYFRYAAASTKTFGRMFTSELDTVTKVAEDRVKKLQTQYIKLGRDSQGAMKAIAVMPNQLDFSNVSTQLQMAAQKQAIFNQLLKQGSTNLLNFGKNTQWAGRQLMVGFTIPLGILGMKAGQTFMEMEKAALKFKKVYGDLLTSPEETKAALDGIVELGKQFTKYGVAVADTVALSAEAAAAGFQGLDLQRQTTEATRLSVLGQIDAQQALETTIALQNAFKMSSEDLADSINFLNAVENQTVTSLDDITIAIPKVAPVIRQLGGDVKDLAFFITAMKQGGINASEGANALKSGLAALINPTTRATSMLADLGININKIVESNQGDIKGTVIGFAEALDTLDPLNRARAIEQMFGKFQFARLSALFSNVITDGTQASRVLDLAGSSIEDLAALSEKELGMTAASPMNRFKKAIEDLNTALVPVGETFIKAVTPIVEFFTNILAKFSGLSENTKKIITILTIAIAGVGPVLLMTFGLLANGVANIIKLFATLRNGYLRLTGQSSELGQQTNYMTSEQLEAAAAAHSLNQSHANLTQTFNVERESLNQLVAAYQAAARAASSFAATNPGMMLPGPTGKKPKKFSVGKPYVVGGSGNKDSEPAMLTPGETVIPADMSKKYSGLINGMIAGNIPGYNGGKVSIYPEFMMRLQDAVENMGQRSGNTSVPNVLSPLAMRVGEARGIAPTQSAVAAGKFDDIYAEYEELTQAFVDKVNQEYNETFKDIKDSNERMQKAWTSAGKSVEKQVDSIASGADKGVIRKVFGLDPDEYGTIPTDSREAGGTTPNRGRRGAFKSKMTGWRSYTAIRPGAKKLYERMTGKSAAALQMGHIMGPESVDISSLESDPRKTGAVASAASILARGKKDGESYAKGVESSTKDVYLETRDRNSPHPQAIKDGKDDGVSYAKGVKDGVAQSGRRVATRPQGPAPIGVAAPAGATMLPIVSKPTRRDLLKTKVSRGVSGVASRLAGSFGSGRGIGIASGAMMASQFIPGKAGEVAGQISSLGFAAQAGFQALKLLPGPAKLAAVGFLAAVGTVKLFNAVQERARLKVEGLGDAAAASGKQLSTLGNFFGIKPRELSREKLKSGETSAAIGATQKTAVDALRETEDFQKEFKNDINALKDANIKDATMIFNALAVQLKGRGFASEQIKTIIQALQQEAGKTSIKLDFKDIGVANEESLTQQAKVIGFKISKTLSDSAKRNKENSTSGFINEEELASINAAGASMSAIFDGLIGQFEGGEISLAKFQSGVDSLNSAILKMPAPTQAQLIKVLFSKIGPEAAKAATGIKGVSTQLKVMLALSSGIISAEDPILKVLRTATDPKTIGRAQNQLSKKVRAFYKAFEIETQAGVDEVVKTTAKGAKEVEEKWTLFGQFKEDRVAIKNRVEAYRKLTAAGIDAATAADVVSEAQVAKALAEGKVTKEIIEQIGWYKKRVAQDKAITEEVEKYNEALAEKERLLKRTPAEVKQDELKKLSARYELGEAIVNAKYSDAIEKEEESLRKQQYALELVNEKLKEQQDILDKAIKPKEDRVDEINYQLEKISFSEDDINEKYEKQSKLLSVISKMNEDLFSIQKKRISLADALSSGDISAAASIIMDMRAEEAAVQASSQQAVLDAAKEQELAALNRVGLERESKKLQFEILTLQRQQSTVLQQNADTIQDNIDQIQSKLSSYRNAMENDIATLNQNLRNQFGMSRTQIESAMKMIDLANTAGFDMNSKTLITNIMSAALGDARELRDIMNELAGIEPKLDTRSPAEKAVDEAEQAATDALREAALAEAAAAEAEKAIKELEEYLKSIGLGDDFNAPPTSGVVPGFKPPNGVVDRLEPGDPGFIGPVATETSQPSTTDSAAAADALRKLTGGQTLTDAEKKLLGISTTPSTSTTTTAETNNTVSAAVMPVITEKMVEEALADLNIPTIVDPFANLGQLWQDAGGISLPGLAAFNPDTFMADLNASLAAMGYMSRGGIVPKYFAKGGFNRGTDIVPAMLTPGEFVVNKKATAGLGINNLTKINNGEMPSGSVYNYKVDVTLNGSDMNPNDVANAVLTKIKQLESRNIRRQGI